MRAQAWSILLAGALAGSAAAQPQTDTGSAPTQITTNNGRTYRQVSILDVEPDGLVVSYQPEAGGLGMATLKFRDLPDSLRNRYGYNEQAASQYEAQQAQATAQWRAQQSAPSPFERYRNLAELNRALGGDAFASYSVSLDSNGKLSAEGVTQNGSPFSYPATSGEAAPYAGLPSYWTVPPFTYGALSVYAGQPALYYIPQYYRPPPAANGSGPAATNR